MTEEIVNKICNVVFQMLPTEIIRNNVGLAGYVYIVQINNEKYVVKISDDKNLILGSTYWLDKIKDLDIFEDDLYFVGGTALSYFIKHRVSEDIDIVSPKILKYKNIIPIMQDLGAKKIEDENTFSLRLAGMFPDEYILKFILDDVKIEFFCANRPIQKEILKQIEFVTYYNSRLKILDLKQIAKLKVIAFFQRDKIRDLFDFGEILENKIVSFEDILQISKELKNISSQEQLIKFILDKKEEKDDENVYLDEQSRIDLSFFEIKKAVLKKIEKIGNQKKCKT